MTDFAGKENDSRDLQSHPGGEDVGSRCYRKCRVSLQAFSITAPNKPNEHSYGLLDFRIGFCIEISILKQFPVSWFVSLDVSKLMP